MMKRRNDDAKCRDCIALECVTFKTWLQFEFGTIAIETDP